MAPSNQVLFKIVLPLILAAVAFSAVNTLKAKTLDPQKKQVKSSFDLLKERQAPIGKDTVGKKPQSKKTDQIQARNQFKGLVTWNALVGTDCSAFWEMVYQTSKTIRSGNNPKKVTEPPILKKVDGPHPTGDDPEYAASFRTFIPLAATGFEVSCTGPSSIGEKMKSKSKGALKKMVGKVAGGTGKVIGGIVGGAAGSVATFAAPVLGGAAVSAGAYIGKEAGGDAGKAVTNALIDANTGVPTQVANDMEGKYGTGYFNMTQSIRIGSIDALRQAATQVSKDGEIGGSDARYMAKRNFIFALDLNYNEEGDCKGSDIDNKPDECLPLLWGGGKALIAVPDIKLDKPYNYGRILSWEEAKGNTKHDDNGAQQSGRYEAGRVRMTNVPLVAENPSPILKGEGIIGDSSEDSKTEDTIESLLKGGYFLLCEGAQGYVQSNVKKIGNKYEAKGNNPEKEDVVFPQAKITEKGFESCSKIRNPEPTSLDYDRKAIAMNSQCSVWKLVSEHKKRYYKKGEVKIEILRNWLSTLTEFSGIERLERLNLDPKGKQRWELYCGAIKEKIPLKDTIETKDGKIDVIFPAIYLKKVTKKSSNKNKEGK